MKHKKHNKIITDYDHQKSKHLEKIATKSLKDAETRDKLKQKNIDTNFLDLF